MKDFLQSRRRFLKTAAISTGAVLLPRVQVFSRTQASTSIADTPESRSADYVYDPVRLRIILTATPNVRDRDHRRDG